MSIYIYKNIYVNRLYLNVKSSFGAPSTTWCNTLPSQDPNEGNEDGVVPLILAAQYGHLACVRALCDAGANVNLAAEAWAFRFPIKFLFGKMDAKNALVLQICLVRMLWRSCPQLQGWGTPLDGAEGEVAAYLESRGAKRSEQGPSHFDRPVTVHV